MSRAEKDGGVWLAPSLEHKVEIQQKLFAEACKVMPISSAVFEMGKFDPTLMKAIEAGKPAPQGEEYQHGGRYRIATLRAAVFARDNHTCVFCKRGIREHAILHVHHIGFWKHDRTDRLGNLAACCEQCHTSENHKPGGLIYGQKPEVPNTADATYMNVVRFELLRRLKQAAPDVDIHIRYGAGTSMVRRECSIQKIHTNDAYCLGKFFPKHRASETALRKTRRNDRILQKFYDAVYVDLRDGALKKGQELTNGRISRNHKKDHEDLHPFRGRKASKGRIAVRRSRKDLKPGSLVVFGDEVLVVHGTHTKRHQSKKTGKVTTSVNVEFQYPAKGGRKSAQLSNAPAKGKCTPFRSVYNTGWRNIPNSNTNINNKRKEEACGTP